MEQGGDQYQAEFIWAATIYQIGYCYLRARAERQFCRADLPETKM